MDRPEDRHEERLEDRPGDQLENPQEMVGRADRSGMGWSIPPDLIRSQLGDILASPMFDASERNRRFLRYIVDETLANRGDRIKGYNIGVFVFGRDTNFDPQADPVVRVEAGRLRRSLERYYLTDGKQAAVRVNIPKGSYAASFSWNPRETPQIPSRTLSSRFSNEHSYSIFLMPFVPLSVNDDIRRLSVALSEEIALELSRHDEFNIFRPPVIALETRSAWPDTLREAPADLVFSGSVRMCEGNLRTVAHLVDRVEGRQLWSASFDRHLTMSEPANIEADLGREIVAVMADGCFFSAP